MAKTNSSIQTFSFAEGVTVRSMLDENNQPWFVAADVCTALEVRNPRDAVARLDDDERGVVIADTLGGRQEFSTINESGLYSLILTSRKPEAKKFKKWVTSEVLPAIRKTGSYGVGKPESVADVPQAIEYKPLNPQQQVGMAKAVRIRAKEASTTTLKIYRELRDVYEVASWKEIPADKYTEAKALVKSMVLEGELMPRQTAPMVQPQPAPQYSRTDTITIPASDWFGICNIIRSMSAQVRDRLDNYRYNTIDPQLEVELNRAIGMIYTHTFNAFGVH